MLIGKRLKDDPSEQGGSQSDTAPTTSPQGGPSRSDSARASWKTLSPTPKRHLSYPVRMASLFALVAALTALIFVIVLAFVWEGQFLKYTRANMERTATAVATALSERYEHEGGLTRDDIEGVIGGSSLASDIGAQVLNADGAVVYDDTWSRESAVTGKAVAPAPIPGNAPTSSDSTVTVDVMLSDGRVVGFVRLWAFGSDALLTKGDAAFRESSYAAIGTAAVIAIIIAIITGVIVSRKLSKPIKRITSTAAQIRSGDLTARTGLVGNDEIGQLGETFDDMATTLERDLKLEHRLTSDVAHELRTPLMAMLATVEAMQDGVLPADDEHFETVAGEVRRLSRLVGAMLQLSRIENGTTPFKPERTDMVGLVRSVVDSQEQLFAARDLRLRLDVKGSRKEIFAEVDRDMIRQCIVNLLSNAMRYTPAGGWAVVSVEQDGREVAVAVSDTGMGIAKEDLARVFSRFWRSDASRERESGGLGVGLALTKEIIDRHHGYIGVESELGKGAKFTLHIPRSQVPPCDQQGREQGSKAPHNSSTMVE